MTPNTPDQPALDSLEQQIAAWRAHLRTSRAITDADAAELEDHLREQIASLKRDGLSPDEAFLVAVKRIGAVDALTREFAREHSERLWKQLVLAGDGWDQGGAEVPSAGARKMWVALGLAVAAGAAIKVPALFGTPFGPDPGSFYPLNGAFFTLPFIAAYFAWDRPLSSAGRIAVAAAFAAAAGIVNSFPFAVPLPDTQRLTILSLPITLWLLVGVAYVGGRWFGNDRRMDFVRFTGETFIYFVLIALGGFVLIGITFALFRAIGLEPQTVVQEWILPCGFAGATVIASWLVEAKQSVIENMAPVLTRIFTPLFTLVMLAFLATMLSTGRGLDMQREVLVVFDILLVVVFGLLLYSISARDFTAPPGLFDRLQLILVGTALIVDTIALWAIGTRISTFGFTPNRIAALGENLVLLVNLSVSGVLYLRFVRGRIAFSRLADWQTSYLPVFSLWGSVVAFLFPVIFGFR